MKFHDDGDLNNVRNDHDGGGRSVRVNDEYHDGDYDSHRVRTYDVENHDDGYDGHHDRVYDVENHDDGGRSVRVNGDEYHDGDYDGHRVHAYDVENHDDGYDGHRVHDSVLHDEVFLHFYSIVDSILV